MSSTTEDDGSADAAKLSSGDGSSSPVGLARTLADIAARGVNASDGTLWTARFCCLHGQVCRGQALCDLVLGRMPSTINPAIWLSWLSGGVEPFKGRRLRRPEMVEVNSGRARLRSSQRLAKAAFTMVKAPRP